MKLKKHFADMDETERNNMMSRVIMKLNNILPSDADFIVVVIGEGTGETLHCSSVENQAQEAKGLRELANYLDASERN